MFIVAIGKRKLKFGHESWGKIIWHDGKLLVSENVEHFIV